MRVPFQVPAKSVQDKDKTMRVVHGFIYFMEQAQDDAAGGMKKAVQEGAVLKEKSPQAFIYGKDAVSVADINQLKGHICSPFHGIFIAACGAEAAFAAERDKFKLPAFWAAVHGAAECRIAAVDHFFDILHLTAAWMEGIFYFFIMVFENLL